jgi:hypothetical protein
LNAPVLKTGVGKPIVSSNLTGPAKFPYDFGSISVPLSIKCPSGQLMLYFSIGHIMFYRKAVISGSVYCQAKLLAQKNRHYGRL